MAIIRKAVGKVGGLLGFGKSSSKKSAQEIEAEEIAKGEKEEAERKRKEAEELLAQKKKKEAEYKARGERMGGGGREGLMFKRSQTGVL